MSVKNFRRIQQTYRQRISHDLVLTRMGEHTIRDINVLVRSTLFDNVDGSEGIILDGLVASPGTGLSVDLTSPAVAIQKIETDEVSVVLDNNDDTDFNVVLEL